MKYFKTYIIALCLILYASLASAQAPGTIMYQGKLADDAGAAITTATSVTFSIYAAVSGGSELYTTTIDVTPDASGIFTVELGPFGATVFNGATRFLGINVDGDGEMEPRQTINSTPYSIKSTNLEPIAFATINGANGDVYSGTPNVSCSWNSTSNRYEIAIAGESYSFSSYTTVVTCSGNGYLYRTGSIGGSLLVYFYDTSGTLIQNPYQFQFVTFKYPTGKSIEIQIDKNESDSIDESTAIIANE